MIVLHMIRMPSMCCVRRRWPRHCPRGRVQRTARVQAALTCMACMHYHTRMHSSRAPSHSRTRLGGLSARFLACMACVYLCTRTHGLACSAHIYNQNVRTGICTQHGIAALHEVASLAVASACPCIAHACVFVILVQLRGNHTQKC
jgi:hypothetical protein